MGLDMYMYADKYVSAAEASLQQSLYLRSSGPGGTHGLKVRTLTANRRCLKDQCAYEPVHATGAKPMQFTAGSCRTSKTA